MMRREAVALAGLLLLNACAAPVSVGPVSDALPDCARPQAVASRTYFVFFDHHSSALTTRARTIIGEFTAHTVVYDRQHVGIAVSSDTSEITRQDRGLAQRRGDAVALAMRESGIPADTVITIRPVERDKLLVPTADNTPEPQNRNALLRWVGGRQIRPTERQAECRAWLQTHPCGPDAGSGQAAVCAKVRSVADEFKGGP